MLKRLHRGPGVLGWLVVGLMTLTCLPFFVSDNEYSDFRVVSAEDAPKVVISGYPGDMVMVAINSSGDTLFGVDSLDVNYEWTNLTRDIDWIHSLAIRMSGGDSAAIGSVKIYLSPDGTNYYQHGSAILTAADSDTAVTVSIPMAKAVRFRFMSTADQDSTILSGYYIFR